MPHTRSRQLVPPRSATCRPRLERLEDRELLAVSAAEQLFVYQLNRARANPVAYQQEVGLPVSLAYVTPRPPLAVNDLLFASAEFKSEEMATHNYFGHQSQVTGVWPNQLVRSRGYPLPSLFVNNANYLESISYGWAYPGRNPEVATAGAALEGLIYDEGINPPGHRNHLLGIDAWNANFREIGVGHAARSGAINYDYWTIHTGYVSTADVFLTGVAYADRNANRRYDLGEGLGNVTVTAAGRTTTTNAAGGWSLAVTPGTTYTLTAAGGAFVGTAGATVGVGSANVEVDFLSGRTGAQVNFVDRTTLINNAPVLSAGVALSGTREDVVSPGNYVSRLTAAVSDADTGALRGVAITGSSGSGVWQYHTGVRWLPMGVVTDSVARLLPGIYRLRFVPAANWNGQATLTYRAWDRTSGVAGGLANLSLSESVGGLTAFSAAQGTATLNVTAVNDAPTQPLAGITLAGISRAGGSSGAIPVSSLLGGAADLDGPGLGIAVIGASGPGRWEFSTDGGTTWRLMGAVSRTVGRLLRGSDLVRFVPGGAAGGTAALGFLAWDESLGVAGSAYAVPLAVGGTTPFSARGRTAWLPVA